VQAHRIATDAPAHAAPCSTSAQRTPPRARPAFQRTPPRARHRLPSNPSARVSGPIELPVGSPGWIGAPTPRAASAAKPPHITHSPTQLRKTTARSHNPSPLHRRSAKTNLLSPPRAAIVAQKKYRFFPRASGTFGRDDRELGFLSNIPVLTLLTSHLSRLHYLHHPTLFLSISFTILPSRTTFLT
jgi:hypothetical protein